MSTRAKGSASKEGSAVPQALSIEQLRRKAKLQLAGSAVLVLVGVVVFAFLLDTPPRANTNQVAIVIPSRENLTPLAAVAPLAPLATPPALPAASSSAQGVLVPVSKASASASASASLGSTTEAPTAVTNVPEVPKVRASAAAPETTASTTAGETRFVLQIGAFTDAQKIRAIRQKLERAGIKTYAQVVSAKEGQRTRIRVGPFATKAEAEKTAIKIKALDLPAAVLTL